MLSSYKARVALKIAILVLLVIVTNLEARIFYRLGQLVFNFGGYGGAIIFSFLWALSLVALFAAAFLKNPYIRIALAALISVSSAVGFAYEHIAGTQIGYDSLAIIWESRRHANDAVAFYKSSFAMTSISTAVIFLAIAILPERNRSRVQGELFLPQRSGIHSTFARLSPPIAISPIVIIIVISLFRAGSGTDGLPNQYKVPSLFLMILINNQLASTIEREEVSIPIAQRKLKPHVVLIVDESVRGDYLDINFDRNISPKLLSNRHRIANFGYATSSTNCSAGSNLIFRMGGNPGNLQESLQRNPYLWSYAKHAGYKTVLIEAQAEKGQNNNRMSLQEVNTIDEFIYAKGDSRRARDLQAAKIVREKLESDTPSLIYVVKYGLHFPYDDAYEPEEAVFRPHMNEKHIATEFVESVNRENKRLMINSYKNAISLSADRFFEALFFDNMFDNSVLIYTSDHGQNLLDNAVELTHCTTDNPIAYEALVPLFAVTDHPLWIKKFQEGATRNLNKTSQFHVFPTLLNILGYDRKQVNERFGPSLFDNITDRNHFVSGFSYADARLRLGDHDTVRWHEGIQVLLDSGQLIFRPAK